MPALPTAALPVVSPAALLEQLNAALEGGQAHTKFEAAVAEFPTELHGALPAGLPYSAWQLVEHMRIAQRDILDFSAPPSGGYEHKAWPTDYWPKAPEPPSPSAWEETLAAIQADRATFEGLLAKPGADLTKPFRWGEGQNLLREAMLLVAHTSYHTGELIVLRRLLGIWNPS